ncbi:MAG: hypothetical protein OHK0029_12330 [Armatimonadaceae bacterium]
MDHTGRIVDFNPAAETTFGYSATEVRGQLLSDVIIPPALRAAHRAGLEKYLATGEGPVLGKRIEIEAMRSSGDVFPVELAISVLSGEGEILFSAYLRDISERVRARAERIQAQAALEDAHRFIREVTESAPNIIHLYDVQNRHNVYRNRDFGTILGYSDEKSVALVAPDTDLSLLHPDDCNAFAAHLDELQTLRDGEVRELMYRVRHADGHYLWLRSRDTVFQRSEDGAVRQVLRSIEDFTERREAEVALAQSEARLSTLISNFQSAILVEDEKRRVVLTNPPFCQMFGIPVECTMLVGMDCAESAQQSKHLFTDPETFVARVETLLRNREPVIAEEVRMLDGRVLERDYVPIFIAEAYSGHLWLYRDITARKQAEDQLRALAQGLQQSNRELDHFASVASHDLQEPLRKIRMFGDCLQDHLGKSLDEDGQFYLNRMRDAANRMKLLIDGLLQFSRITTKARPFQTVPLSRVAQEVVEDLEARIQDTQGMVYLEDLPLIQADAIQMRQLLQNLIGNALKFHRPGVPPEVRVEGTIATAPETLEDWLTLTVSDNGTGFEPEYQETIFRVFERLHDSSEYDGTGIGLAICRKIADRHGGMISATSTPGQGSTFTVQLPIRQVSTDGNTPSLIR